MSKFAMPIVIDGRDPVTIRDDVAATLDDGNNLLEEGHRCVFVGSAHPIAESDEYTSSEVGQAIVQAEVGAGPVPGELTAGGTSEPAYTVVGTCGEAGRPYVVTVYTHNGPEAAMTLAHEAYAEKAAAGSERLPELQLVAILADAERARLIDFDEPATWPKRKATILVPTNRAELVAVFGEEADVSPVGRMPAAVEARIGELRSILDPSAHAVVARDREIGVIAAVDGDSVFDGIAFTDDGRVGLSTVNQPIFYPTISAMRAAI